MRGGLDDALEKLARRDELRRRTAGEATGTPPAVQELVEAIAAVVGRNPKLTVTVGVEGAGDPTLLHFTYEDGVVQVNADRSVAARAAETAPTPRHADFDFDIELDDSAAEQQQQPYQATPAYAGMADEGEDTRRLSYDDQDRYDPGMGYATSGPPASPSYAEHILYAEHPYEGHRRHANPPAPAQRSTPPEPTRSTPPETTRYAPPEPPRGTRPPKPEAPPVRPAAPQRGMPTPLPEPIPLKLDTREAEQAAKRLAALLRDNPTLLRQSHQD